MRAYVLHRGDDVIAVTLELDLAVAISNSEQLTMSTSELVQTPPDPQVVDSIRSMLELSGVDVNSVNIKKHILTALSIVALDFVVGYCELRFSIEGLAKLITILEAMGETLEEA